MIFILIAWMIVGVLMALTFGDHLIDIGYGNDTIIFVLLSLLVFVFWPIILLVAVIVAIKNWIGKNE